MSIQTGLTKRVWSTGNCTDDPNNTKIQQQPGHPSVQAKTWMKVFQVFLDAAFKCKKNPLSSKRTQQENAKSQPDPCKKTQETRKTPATATQQHENNTECVWERWPHYEPSCDVTRCRVAKSLSCSALMMSRTLSSSFQILAICVKYVTTAN